MRGNTIITLQYSNTHYTAAPRLSSLQAIHEDLKRGIIADDTSICVTTTCFAHSWEYTRRRYVTPSNKSGGTCAPIGVGIRSNNAPRPNQCNSGRNIAATLWSHRDIRASSCPSENKNTIISGLRTCTLCHSKTARTIRRSLAAP